MVSTISISGIFTRGGSCARVQTEAGRIRWRTPMRAVVIHEYGGPEVLKLEERPEPKVRDMDILVEVHATSVNPVDTKVRQNSSAQRTLPLILGFDVSGVVVRCGPRVTQWKPGDEVFATANLFR